MLFNDDNFPQQTCPDCGGEGLIWVDSTQSHHWEPQETKELCGTCKGTGSVTETPQYLIGRLSLDNTNVSADKLRTALTRVLEALEEDLCEPDIRSRTLIEEILGD